MPSGCGVSRRVAAALIYIAEQDGGGPAL